MEEAAWGGGGVPNLFTFKYSYTLISYGHNVILYLLKKPKPPPPQIKEKNVERTDKCLCKTPPLRIARKDI